MSTNLMELVSHLQSLEYSFATVLMEAAMKIGSLTDANIFVLVETREGRRFTGKRHLCDLYARGDLAPVGDDVELVVDPSISSVRNQPLFQQHRHLHQEQTGAAPSFLSSNGAGDASVHRSRRKRSLDHRRDRLIDFSGGAAASPPSFKIRRSSENCSPADRGATGVANSAATSAAGDTEEIKLSSNQRRQLGDEEAPVVKVDVAADGGGVVGGGAETDDDALDDDVWVEDPQPTSTNDSASNFFYGSNGAETSSSPTARTRLLDAGPSSNHGAVLTLNDAASMEMTMTSATQAKIDAVREFPLEQSLTKGSAANKLLSSLLYDVVKVISQTCFDLGFVSAKEASAKDIFYSQLENFLKRNFPHFLTTDLMFYEGSNRMSAVAYIRSKTRVMFFMRMKALSKSKFNATY